jgi:hypothetical protein
LEEYMTTAAMLLGGLARSMACVAMLAAAIPTIADEADVVAINVLAVPDQAMRDAARDLNERLLRDNPRSFAFDESHVPHISILQRFVATKDLPQIHAAIEEVASKHQLAGEKLSMTGVERSRWNDADIVSIKVGKNPELDRMQADLIEALRPYPAPSGGHDAFVTSPGPADIDRQTIQYVATFEQKQVGDRFEPHITVGLADSHTSEQLQFQLTAPKQFTIDAIAIYQLGNVGTARKQLWRSPRL